MRRSMEMRLSALEKVRWLKRGKALPGVVILAEDETFEQYVARMELEGYVYDPDDEHLIMCTMGGAEDRAANGEEVAAMPAWQRAAQWSSKS